MQQDEQPQNRLIAELESIANLITGRQKDFYRQMIDDAKPVVMTPISEVFTPEQIELIKEKVAPKIKQCYLNAFNLTTLFPEILYVEGKMTLLDTFGIDHAFNKVGDRYVDITVELALNEEVNKEEYISLGEYDKDVMIETALQTRVYGGVYNAQKGLG